MAGARKAAALAAVLAGGAAAALAGGGEPEVEPGGPVFNRFLFFAVLEGACEDALPPDALKAILEQDEKGRYRNFIYGCPVCGPVQNGFEAYRMRDKYLTGWKGDPLVDELSPSPVARLAVRLAGPDAASRGAALHDLVARWVNRRMDRLRFTDPERAAWREALAAAREKGMAVLESSRGAFALKSCPSCDGATGNDDPWK